MKYKINEDIFYSTSADTFSFYIENNGVTIFKGRAYKSPDKATCDINITDICRDWVCNKLPDFRNYTDSAVSQTEAYQEFKLYTYSGNTEELVPMLLETYNILFDWDYDMPWSGQSCTLSEPVNGHMDSRMKLVYSVYRDTTGESICYERRVYPIIDYSPKSITCLPVASSYTITVTSNTTFNCTKEVEWITLNNNSGDSGVTIIAFNVSSNISGESRNTNIHLNYANENGEILTKNVYVIQDGAYVIISTTSPYILSNNGGIFNINVSSNTQWEFTISSYEPAPSSTENYLIFTLNDNNTVYPNTSGISIFGSEIEEIKCVGNQNQIIFENIPTKIGECAFSGKTSISWLYVPEGVTELSRYCFKGCTSLSYAYIPSTITRIGTAFFDCTNLQRLYFMGTMTQWNNIDLNSSFAYRSRLTQVNCKDGIIRL